MRFIFCGSERRTVRSNSSSLRQLALIKRRVGTPYSSEHFLIWPASLPVGGEYDGRGKGGTLLGKGTGTSGGRSSEEQPGAHGNRPGGNPRVTWCVAGCQTRISG